MVRRGQRGHKGDNEVSNSTIPNANSSLPENWRWVRLGELFDVQQGVAMSPQRREGISPHPFLRTLNVLWGHIDLSILDEMDFTDEEVAKLSLKRGDLLVCEGGAVGRTAIWRGELEGCLHQNHIHRLRRLNDDVVPDFYMYWMQAAFQVFGLYGGQESKTTIPNLSGSRLKLFTVPLLPVEEQKRIAARVQELIAEVERARNACEAQLEAAKALPLAYLRQVFESEETKKWERRRLGEICELAYGASLPGRDREAGNVPVYGSNGVVGYHNTPITTGSTIIVGRKGSIGEINYSDVACWPIDTTYYIDGSKTSCDLHWLFLLLRWLRLDIFNRATGVPGLNRNDAYNQFIPLPPLYKQRLIASELKEKMAQTEKLKEAIEKQLEGIDALPKAILEKAFIGEM